MQRKRSTRTRKKRAVLPIEEKPVIDPAEQLVTQLVDAHGIKSAKKALAKSSGYIDVPPTITEFMEDPYYLGDVFDLYPVWHKSLNQIYPNEFFSPYLEICLTGAIGLGKTTVSLVGTAYDMCKLQHMVSPTEYSGLSRTTRIAFAMINANMELSKKVLMDQVDDIMEQSPYFKQLRAEALSSKARAKSYLPKNINVVKGSRFTHVLGQAVVGAVLSELNFQDRVKDQAYENYTNTLTRLQSRFMACKARTGSYPGRIWLDSSKNDANSFVESHLESNIGNPELLLLDYAFWEVHAHRMQYSGKTFKVFTGDQNRDPFIVDHARQIVGISEEAVIDVPVEHEDRFRQNLPKSLRDIAGKGTWSSAKLIPTVERIKQALRRPNPIKKEVIHLDFFDKSQRLIDYVNLEDLASDTRPRFIHLDLGLKNDKTGIASTRLDGWVTTQHTDPITLETRLIKSPMFHTEWVISVAPIPGQEVPIWKLKEFIIMLRQRGIPIAQVSTDGYQSTNLRQDLTLNGYDCRLLSVDRTKDQYTQLKDCILESRWDGVKHPLLEKELKELVDTGKKIDHPFDGCFTADTPVANPKGSPHTMQSLCEMANRGEEAWIYAVSAANKKVVPAKIKNCWITKTTRTLVTVTLNNEESVQCTPDHRFMLADGTYKQAIELLESDELMPSRANTLFAECRVKSVVKTLLQSPVPVYDLEVPHYHNFALGAGCFVHNSKDLTDAVAGSIAAAADGLEKYSANNKMDDYAEVLDQLVQPNNLYNQISQRRG